MGGDLSLLRTRLATVALAHYSGNAHGVITGIGVVTCVYVNPELNQFWLIDYRIYDPAGDGQRKLDHVREMLNHTVYHKQLPFQAVLMDTWYATQDLMLFIESLEKIYYCPLKDNRQGMIPMLNLPIGESIRSTGIQKNSLRASDSKSKAFPKTTKCSVSGLRCLPITRTSLSPTIWLKTRQRPLNRRMAFVF